MISEADINDVEKFPPLVSQAEAAANDMFSPSKKKAEKVEPVVEEVKKVEEKSNSIQFRLIWSEFIKIKAKAMIEEFKSLGEHIKADTKLASLDPAEVPVLNIAAKADLEAINPTPAKDIVKTLIFDVTLIEGDP